MKYYHKYLKYKFKYQQLKGGFHIPKITFGNKNVSCLLLPHAGSIYVEDVMKSTFFGIRPDYKSIIILTTNHIDNENYQPEDDFKWNLQIFHLDGIPKNNSHFDLEHSHMSLLPYVEQFHCPIYLLSLGKYDEKIIRFLKEIIDKDILLIGNTDLLHCGPSYTNECPANIEKYNMEIITDLLAKNSNKDLCGKVVVQTFLKLCETPYESFNYTSSDIITGGKDSVGYVGIVYCSEINLQNFSYLFSIPKETLENPELKFLQKLFIKDITGIFVTIYKNGNLRGCIGTFELIGDIINTIKDRTLHSAYYDSRFSPITPNEFKFLSYKINFLKKPFEVKENEVVNVLSIGKHGITITFSDNRSATYLASVLPESFGITSENIKNKIINIYESLKDKCGSTGKIQKIELYECDEFPK